MTDKEAVYLCGAIEGVSKESMTGWRTEATKYLADRDIRVLDPTRRLEFHKTDMDQNHANRVLKMDLQDIAHSRVILADMRDSQPGRKLGSAMEIQFAQTKHKIIILLVDEEQFKHPFLFACATEIHHNLSDALEACAEYYL